MKLFSLYNEKTSLLLIKYIAQHTKQCRNYKAPRLPPNLMTRVRKIQNPDIPDAEAEYLEGIDKSNREDVLNKRKQLWAQFGSKSGIDPKTIMYTYEDIINEEKAEKQWWPTLQDMQKDIARIKQYNKELDEKRQKKIKENMLNMPKWIEEYEKNLQEEKEAIEKENLDEEINFKKAKETFGYDINKSHPKMIEYLEAQQEALVKKRKQERKEKRKLAKASPVSMR